MKKVKVTKVKNPISTKPMPHTPEPPLPGRAGFAGPGINIPVATKNYKKGR